MAEKSLIEWTDATWNPITGCSIVSPGCRRCYAMKLAGTRLRNHPSRHGLTIDTKDGPVWNGELQFNEDWLLQPVGWKKPRMIFVCAHSDLFHPAVPDAWIDRVFASIALAPQHTYQILTKRPARMCEYLSQVTASGRQWYHIGEMGHKAGLSMNHIKESMTLLAKTLPHVWCGTSIERQKEADERLPHLRDTPAAVRFISAEPLLGPIDLGSHVKWLDWVIVGGESASDAKPMHPAWVRSFRTQCLAGGVPFLFKQWGSWITEDQAPDDIVLPGTSRLHFAQRDKEGGWTKGDQTAFYLVGKKAAGRLLDGREHNGMPGRFEP